MQLTVSRDPVGAPIFYRDVPLMPSATEKGVIKPLAASAIPLIEWRMRDISEPSSHFGTEVAKGMCHGGLKARPGDLALFKVARSRVYNHGAIVTEWPRGVHAQREGVREVDLSRHHLTAYHEAAIFNPWGDEE
jgi:hypothetical protein